MSWELVTEECANFSQILEMRTLCKPQTWLWIVSGEKKRDGSCNLDETLAEVLGPRSRCQMQTQGNLRIARPCRPKHVCGKSGSSTSRLTQRTQPHSSCLKIAKEKRSRFVYRIKRDIYFGKRSHGFPFLSSVLYQRHQLPSN